MEDIIKIENLIMGCVETKIYSTFEVRGNLTDYYLYTGSVYEKGKCYNFDWFTLDYNDKEVVGGLRNINLSLFNVEDGDFESYIEFVKKLGYKINYKGE